MNTGEAKIAQERERFIPVDDVKGLKKIWYDLRYQKVPATPPPPLMVSYTATGLSLGIPIGAALVFGRRMSYLRDRKRKEQSRLREEKGYGRDTIVLTLPKKAETVPCSREMLRTRILKGIRRQPRRIDGTLGKHAQEREGTLGVTKAQLAGLGVFLGSATLITALYNTYKKHELDRELEGARSEYLDALLSKHAQTRASTVATVGGTALSLTILGSMAVAYTTKKVMDEYFEDRSKTGLKVPKASRIVFQTIPSGEPEKQASADDLNAIKAAVCVNIACMAPEQGLFDDPLVKLAMAADGTNREEMVKYAQNWAGDMSVGYYRKNPEAFNALVLRTMEKNPVLKHFTWARNIPVLKDLINMIAMKLVRQRGSKAAPEFVGGAVGRVSGAFGGARKRVDKLLNPEFGFRKKPVDGTTRETGSKSDSEPKKETR
jgi:hypothetical protein